MGDGPDRITTAPANKATGYGIAAAAGVAARALGEAAESVRDAVPTVSLAAAAAIFSPTTKAVLAGRRIWAKLAAADLTLAKTTIADLDWYAAYASKISGKPAVADLDMMGFEAWTNSSTLVLVSDLLVDPGLTATTPLMPEILLQHEALHVSQFLSIGDQPPQKYRDMVGFEEKAYGLTLASLDALVAAGKSAYKDNADTIRALVKKLHDIATASPPMLEPAILQVMKDNSMLPQAAEIDPASLYVR